MRRNTLMSALSRKAGTMIHTLTNDNFSQDALSIPAELLEGVFATHV